MIRDTYCQFCEIEVYDYQAHRETDKQHKRRENLDNVIRNLFKPVETYSNSTATILFKRACEYTEDEVFTKLTPNNVMCIYQELFKKTYQQYYEIKKMMKEDTHCGFTDPIFDYLDYMNQFIQY